MDGASFALGVLVGVVTMTAFGALFVAVFSRVIDREIGAGEWPGSTPEDQARRIGS